MVVGEGRAARKGLLRFVLEGDGCEVVGEAPDAASLASILAAQQPDVVVLDDGIGVTAVQMVHEVAPGAKVVLVWPEAVVPIGGDARVDPGEVLRQLGPSVHRVAGVAAPMIAGFERPEWIDKVRKDPATLRERLAKKGPPPPRPSVTELQRRGQRLHPPVVPRPAAPADVPPREEPAAAAVAPLVILPTPASDEPTLVLDAATPTGTDERDDWEAVLGAAAGVATAETVLEPATAAVAAAPLPENVVPIRDPGATELNRRLGTMALGGAAVAGALILLLGLSGSRVHTSVVAGDILRPTPSVTASPTPPGGGPTGGPTTPPDANGGNGQPTPPNGGQPTQGPTGGPLSRDHSPSGGGTDTTGSGGTGGGSGGTGGGGGGSGGTGGGGGGTGGGTQTDHDAAHGRAGEQHDGPPYPGRSGDHNPHGGPPGQMVVSPSVSGPPGRTMTSPRVRNLHRHKR